MLTLQNVSCSIAGKQILEDISMHVDIKQHAGLVGRNGSGKSTLFKLIMGGLESETGKILKGNGRSIMDVKQEMPSGDLTPREFLLSQDRERTQLMQDLETYCDEPEKMAEIYDRLIQIKAFDAEARAAMVLYGLGFDEEGQNRPLSSFSGGYRMRVALGSILFQEPDLLLLDEPTNHLDLETSSWLKKFLKSYPKSFLLISHDRDFLNETVDVIFHLKGHKLTKYSGNYDNFIETYALKQKNAEEYNAKMEAKRKHMMAFVERFQYKATKAKQAQSRLKSIAKIKLTPLDANDSTVAFNFPEPHYVLSSNILNFEKVSLGYDNKVVLKNISGTIMHDDRIAIVGANGNGKTTFAKFLAGELKQKKGTKENNSKLQIGFYRQDLFETLDPGKTPFELIKDAMPGADDLQARNHLGRFGFSGDMAFQKIGALSGGEKARLVFSTLTANAPNLLILDEPTNHLDIEMRESLINSLTAYQGAVVLITHDENLLNRVADTIYVVDNGTITTFSDDLKHYESFQQSRRSKGTAYTK